MATLAQRVVALSDRGFDFVLVAAMLNVTPAQVQEVLTEGAEPAEPGGGIGDSRMNLVPNNFTTKAKSGELTHIPFKISHKEGTDIGLGVDASTVECKPGTYLVVAYVAVGTLSGQTGCEFQLDVTLGEIQGEAEDVLLATAPPAFNAFIGKEAYIWHFHESTNFRLGVQPTGGTEPATIANAVVDIVRIA